MSDLGGNGAYVLATGYTAAGVALVLDTVLSLASRSRSSNDRQRLLQETGLTGSARHAAGDRFTRETVPSMFLCLCVLAVSLLELLLPQIAATTQQSKPLTSAVVARIVCSVSCVSWLVGRLSCSGEQGLGSRRLNANVTSAIYIGLGLALLWQAARLAVVGFSTFPALGTLVYLEGLCMIGSLAVMGTAWSSWRGDAQPLANHVRVEASATRDSERGEDTLGAAGWVSVLSFSWLNPLFDTGVVRQLRPEDMPGLTKEDRTAVWANRFGTAIQKERKLAEPSLVRACRLTFGWEFLRLGWLKAANTGLGFAGPLLLKVVVDAVQDASKPEGDTKRATTMGYLGAAGLALTFSLSAILDTQFSLRLGRLQLHVRSSIVPAVYRQVLSVRSADATALGLTTGSATNLIAVDAQRLMDTAGSLHELWSLPVQVGVTFYLLHREVSFAFAAGLVVIAAMIPLNAVLAKRIGVATRELMKHKDDRVQRCSEMLNGVRAVKMLAWEGCMRQRIVASRDKEVSALRTLKYVDAWCVFFWATTPTLVCLATFATLVIVRGEGAPPLRVSSVFTAVSLLQMLIHPMNAFPWVINGIVEAYVSKGRLEKLLLPATVYCLPGAGTAHDSVDLGRKSDAIISWRGVTVTRSSERPPNHASHGGGAAATAAPGEVPASSEGGILEPLLARDAEESDTADEEGEGYGRRRAFSLRDVNLEVSRGEAVAIVGEVGSGKSTLLAGILGEVPVFSTEEGRSWREGNVARRTGAVRANRVCYATQTPWVMSGTVKDNVLFGLPMEEERYREALEACALEADLAIIPGGDMAYVGERGATLSGGQRLRVSLARCAYSASATAANVPSCTGNDDSNDSPIENVLCLLDDPLSSLDAETRDHVAKHCIHGLLRRNPGVAVIVACGEIGSKHSTDENGARECLPRNTTRIPGKDTRSDARGRGINLRSLLNWAKNSNSNDYDGSGASERPARAYTVPSFDRVMRLDSRTGQAIISNAVSPRSDGAVQSQNLDRSSAASPFASVVSKRKGYHPSAGGDNLALFAGTDGTTTLDETSDGARKETNTGEEERQELLELVGIRKSAGRVDGAREERQTEKECVDGDGENIASSSVKGGIGGDESNAGPLEDEERKDGSVELRVHLLYVRSAGLVVTVATLLSLALMQASSAGFRYWLAHWATHQGGVSVRAFLLVTFSIAIANAGFTLCRAFGFAYGGIQAAVVMHRRLLDNILGKEAAFFDVTPSGRVVNRFSRDAFSVDDPLPFHLNVLLAQVTGLVATMLVLSSTSPLLMALFLPLGVVYARLQRYYRSSSRELRRLDSTSRSPMYALFSETLDGAITIRAFGQQELFFNRFVKLLADNQRATFAGSMASAWLSLRLQGLGVVVVAAVAFLAVAQQQLRQLHLDDTRDESLGDGVTDGSYNGLVGLSLTYALPIVGNLTGLLGALTETEREMISVERMDEYCRDGDRSDDHPGGRGREQEDDCEGERAGCRKRTSTAALATPRQDDIRSTSAVVSSEWPREGRLEVSSVIMRYRSDLSPALRGVSLVVEPGQKIGVVGRTGSGKTSLLRALFKMYPYEGSIRLDGVDISMLPTDVLRSRLAVIPQEPLLFRGTIRENLDPSGNFTDASLWDALQSARLADCGGIRAASPDSVGSRHLQLVGGSSGAERDGKHALCGLETELEGYGSNISAGQRQLLCVARVLLKRSKFVCVDEPTSRMDAANAEAVDATMAEAFGEATVLTVAHRLSSVVENCDRVAVMSEGQIVEEGVPRALSSDKTSMFSALLRAQDHGGGHST